MGKNDHDDITDFNTPFKHSRYHSYKHVHSFAVHTSVIAILIIGSAVVRIVDIAGPIIYLSFFISIFAYAIYVTMAAIEHRHFFHYPWVAATAWAYVIGEIFTVAQTPLMTWFFLTMYMSITVLSFCNTVTFFCRHPAHLRHGKVSTSPASPYRRLNPANVHTDQLYLVGVRNNSLVERCCKCGADIEVIYFDHEDYLSEYHRQLYDEARGGDHYRYRSSMG